MCPYAYATKWCPVLQYTRPPAPAWHGRVPARRATRLAWTSATPLLHRQRLEPPSTTTHTFNPLFIKIWVDDRNGTKKTLTPDLINAIAEEAHKFNVPVGVHNVTLANAKLLMRAGLEGWLHVPVRQGEIADEEIIRIVKDRIARRD